MERANARPAHQDAFDLRLLTFNVWGLPAWLGNSSSARFDRIATELDREAPDLVLLQEVWTARAGRSLPVKAEWSVATGRRSPWLCRRWGPDVQAVLRQSQAPTYHAPKSRPRPAKTIDYVFFVPRRGLEFLWGGSEILFAADSRKERLSDHFALQVSLGFEAPALAEPASGLESFAAAPFDSLLLGQLLAPAQPRD